MIGGYTTKNNNFCQLSVNQSWARSWKVIYKDFMKIQFWKK